MQLEELQNINNYKETYLLNYKSLVNDVSFFKNKKFEKKMSCLIIETDRTR